MYELIWPPELLDELADIWVATTPAHRDQIGAGVERLNRELARDPFEVGEARHDDARRVVVVAGLSIFFSVVAGQVRVGHIRWPRRPGR